MDKTTNTFEDYLNDESRVTPDEKARIEKQAELLIKKTTRKLKLKAIRHDK